MFQRICHAIGRWLMKGAFDELTEDERFANLCRIAAERKPGDPSVDRLVELAQRIGAITASAHELIALFAEDTLLAAEIERCGPKFVARHTTHMFSQTYEDAAIAEIFRRIGPQNRRFVEIGVEGGDENTTRLLLMLGWRGLWIEGNPEYVRRIEANYRHEIEQGQLAVRHALATKETVQEIIEQAGFGQDVDFLSVDIDQNTSHVWRRIAVPARVACIEYNAHFPPSIAYEVPYEPEGMWNGTNLFGASLKALEQIGRDKQMSLVGCDLLGVNAYFVRDDCLGDHFASDTSAEFHFQPPRYRFVRGQRGHRRAGG